MATRRPKKPSTWHLVEEGFGIILASLVIIVAAPVFVHSFGGDTAFAQSSELTTVLNAVADIKGQLDALTTKVDALGAVSDTTVTAPGMGQCLSLCRAKEVACLKTAFRTPVTTFSPGSLTSTNTIPFVGAQDTACRKGAETCALACKPQPATVSCEARCAVDLGACIRAAGDNTELAQRCRLRNQVCLADLCVPPSSGSLLLRASRIPSESCRAQCIKEGEICNQTTKQDVNGQADCQNVTKICLSVVCAGTPQPIGTTLLQLCENSCTASFNTCTANANKSTNVAGATATCNARYGTCRDTCRKIGGGTTEPFNPTGTNTSGSSTTTGPGAADTRPTTAPPTTGSAAGGEF